MPSIPRFITDLVKRLTPSQKPPIQGSQRPLTTAQGIHRRRYDLEIEDNPVRDARKAQEYIELIEWSYEVRHCLSRACDDAFASSDGDDQGYTISDTLEDDETPVNAEVKAIALDLIQRKENHESFVIGGDKLKKALKWGLGYGDAFLEIGLEREGIGRGDSDIGISQSLYLPTWELFRKESDQGRLEGFEQRKSLSQTDPNYVFFAPQIIHFRYDPKFLYGESLFKQSLDGWAKLKEAVENLADAARDLGVNPNVHILSEDRTSEDKDRYIEQHELNKMSGIISDIYLSSSKEDIKKLFNGQPSLNALIDNLMQCRYRMIPPGFPTYIFHGLQSQGGTKELSRSPDRIYARMRYNWCQLLTKGIKQAIDTEIILKKGWEWYLENAQNKYRIIWPHWSIDGLNEQEADQTGVNDLEKEDNNKNGNNNNKNGSKDKELAKINNINNRLL